MELIVIASVVVLLVVVGMLVHLYRKSQPLPGPHVFVASRMSAGNRIFPTQVAITPTSVVHYTPHWIGMLEHSINMAHVASVRIDTGLLFSDVFIETTGGQSPVHCKGHHKADAIEIKGLVEQFQTDYYKGAGKIT